MVMGMTSLTPFLPRLADGACSLAQPQTSPGVVILTVQGATVPCFKQIDVEMKSGSQRHICTLMFTVASAL